MRWVASGCLYIGIVSVSDVESILGGCNRESKNASIHFHHFRFLCLFSFALFDKNTCSNNILHQLLKEVLYWLKCIASTCWGNHILFIYCSSTYYSSLEVRLYNNILHWFGSKLTLTSWNSEEGVRAGAGWHRSSLCCMAARCWSFTRLRLSTNWLAKCNACGLSPKYWRT